MKLWMCVPLFDSRLEKYEYIYLENVHVCMDVLKGDQFSQMYCNHMFSGSFFIIFVISQSVIIDRMLK